MMLTERENLKANAIFRLHSLQEEFVLSIVMVQEFKSDIEKQRKISRDIILRDKDDFIDGKMLPRGFYDSIISSDDSFYRTVESIFIQNRRQLLSDPFEVVLDYCKSTNQMGKFKSQEWYPIAKLLRNQCSHYKGEGEIMWPKELDKKGISELSWNGIVVKKGITAYEVAVSDRKAYELFEKYFPFLASLH